MEEPAPMALPRIVDFAAWRRPDAGEAPEAIEYEIERAIREVTAAVLLAAALRRTRVLVGNLAHGADVVDAVADIADEVEVDVEPIERPDGHGFDVAVRSR